jgi:hypothetical protein
MALSRGKYRSLVALSISAEQRLPRCRRSGVPARSPSLRWVGTINKPFGPPKPSREDVVKSAMTKLAKNGKGILLMHDFQHATAQAMPELIRQLKAGGYKIVHMVPKEPVTTLAKYDDMVRAHDKYSSSNNTRSESSVVKTIAR